MSEETDRKVRLWEQHGQSITLAVITAGLFYIGNALVEQKSAQAATATEIKSMASNIARLEGAVTAMQSQYVTRAEFAVHEQRLQSIEVKVRR